MVPPNGAIKKLAGDLGFIDGYSFDDG